ncbi:hypothetical protein LIER_43283 [Lithospermum erythrorhizon]|uniref:Uncharacterized protein n=1 Tax=Lithospermum erythrorhizon TaxID=34254 RepID=A0AAV3PWM6_LITER
MEGVLDGKMQLVVEEWGGNALSPPVVDSTSPTVGTVSFPPVGDGPLRLPMWLMRIVLLEFWTSQMMVMIANLKRNRRNPPLNPFLLLLWATVQIPGVVVGGCYGRAIGVPGWRLQRWQSDAWAAKGHVHRVCLLVVVLSLTAQNHPKSAPPRPGFDAPGAGVAASTAGVKDKLNFADVLKDNRIVGNGLPLQEYDLMDNDDDVVLDASDEIVGNQ